MKWSKFQHTKDLEWLQLRPNQITSNGNSGNIYDKHKLLMCLINFYLNWSTNRCLLFWVICSSIYLPTSVLGWVFKVIFFCQSHSCKVVLLNNGIISNRRSIASLKFQWIITFETLNLTYFHNFLHESRTNAFSPLWFFNKDIVDVLISSLSLPRWKEHRKEASSDDLARMGVTFLCYYAFTILFAPKNNFMEFWKQPLS